MRQESDGMGVIPFARQNAGPDARKARRFFIGSIWR